MKVSVRAAAIAGVFLMLSSAAVALQVRQTASRFDPLVVSDETASLDVATMPLSALAPAEAKRSAWEGFRSTFGADWAIYLDRRSGAPLLAEGRGIPWAAAAPSIDGLAASLRTFIAANKTLLLADDKELSLNRDASTQLTSEVWQIVFDRKVAGIPVVDEQYVFTIGYGNLMSFGASRWSQIEVNPFPELTAAEAEDKMSAYMGLTATDKVTFVGKPQLQIAALRAEGKAALAEAVPYAGAVGSGYASALIWRVVARVEGQEGTWVAVIDAHTGAVRSFVDDDKYARVKGGAYPIANDQICPDGCEQPGFPMPFTTVTIGAATQTSNSLGLFNCAPGGSTATTNLSGPFVRVNDLCGVVAESVSCDADLDLQQSAGTDCAVPAGSGSSGNTHAARTSFYHLNRIAEHARAWLPTRPWLTQQLTNNVNISNTCNAVWSGGTVNFYKSGGGCNNTGEIAGVFLHEWGHGLDQNDGGGFDNPSEAYGDITSIISTHVSCMGRGFRQSGNCSGYGDACLNCSGIRDLDWDAHASHAPMTPSGFVTNNCPAGGTLGPCGREVHCEGYVAGQTLWDLAVRDLPASGLDAASSWQLTDKLWYKSRNGSGGRAYNCSLPNSDGCSAISWFSKLRVIDDDDGNLANGTPHAAAIFAAFDRHKIACGLAGDASNQNQTSCPAVGVPVLSAVAGSSSVSLTWTPAAGATGYRVLRNDASCAAGSTIVATVAGTNYTDAGLANGFTEYYRIQAITANTACDGNVSNCQTATPQPFAGSIKLDAGVYPCSAVIGVSVLDGNAGAGTLQVNVSSDSEPAGETITLIQTPAGSANYIGSIAISTGPAAPDGALSTSHGDAISASYLDGDDGQGGSNLPRVTAAAADCASPAITKVEATNVSWNSARITWKTDEPASSVVRHGTTPPPAGTVSAPSPVFDHDLDVTGLAECTTYVFSAGSTDAVGNTTTDTASGAYYSFTTGKNSAFDYGALDLPLAIPDQSETGATSTITVPQTKTVQDVNVTVTVNHTAAGDLVMTLTAPNGTEIPLVIQRGGAGDNFSGTVFDDEATAAIGNGVAPFPSSYRPELPLSVLDGINSAGAWKLKVADHAGNDVGTFVTWKLTLTYPPVPCGPRAALQSAAIVTDTCGAGGPGSANGRWDAGEQVQFKTTLLNTGTIKLTNVSATIVPLTPGVSMVDGVATFPAFASGISVESIAPHFTALLPTSLSCGGPLSFQITINATEGSWVGTFQQPLGLVLGGTGTPLNETFATGIPVTWNVVDGGSGGGTASTWTVDDPGLRIFTSPLISPVAIVDSDKAGTGATQDEQLLTPNMNLASSPVVTLQFDQYFRWFSGGQDEIADVDVRSSKSNAQWVNVLRQQGSGSANPDHKTLDISSVAGGASNVQVRFHNYGGSSEWWWQVDNVRIDTAAYGGCEMPVCGIAQPNVARPVADGVFGTPMRGSRANASGSSINVTWDVGTCTSADHRVLYGDLANVALLTPNGSFCDLGSSGAATWTGVPSGSLWFIVVGDNNATVEGSWGTDGVGGQRGGTTVSGFCGAVTRTNATTCP